MSGIEPPEIQMIVWRTEIEYIGTAGPNTWGLKLSALPVILHIPTEVPDWKPGDRVKITITKEPSDVKPAK